MTVYDYGFESIEGAPVSMSEYEGKVLLLVNTASKCGFTPQYEGLEALYQEFKDDGFVVIGFPCNQFMEEEPGSDEEIAEFCSVRYGVSFPLSTKVEVRGEAALPLFTYLTEQKRFEGLGKGLKAKALATMLKAKYKEGYNDNQIKWNFTKFLVDRSGQIVKRYESTVEPKDIAVDIALLL